MRDKRTKINGEDHILAYITPQEAELLRSQGGGVGKDGKQVMHKGIPAFYSSGQSGGREAGNSPGNAGGRGGLGGGGPSGGGMSDGSNMGGVRGAQSRYGGGVAGAGLGATSGNRGNSNPGRGSGGTAGGGAGNGNPGNISKGLQETRNQRKAQLNAQNRQRAGVAAPSNVGIGTGNMASGPNISQEEAQAQLDAYADKHGLKALQDRLLDPHPNVGTQAFKDTVALSHLNSAANPGFAGAVSGIGTLMGLGLPTPFGLATGIGKFASGINRGQIGTPFGSIGTGTAGMLGGVPSLGDPASGNPGTSSPGGDGGGYNGGMFGGRGVALANAYRNRPNGGQAPSNSGGGSGGGSGPATPAAASMGPLGWPFANAQAGNFNLGDFLKWRGYA